VASAATYVTTSLRSIYAQQYAPERLELHDFEVDFGNVYAGAISNPNDQEVYIASVFIAWNKGTRFLRVGKTIRPRTFLHFEGDRFDVNQITSAGILAFPKNISGRPFSLDKIYKATNLAVSVKSPDPAKFDEELPCIDGLAQHQIIPDNLAGDLCFNRISCTFNFESRGISDFIERNACSQSPDKPGSQYDDRYRDAENGPAEVRHLEESHGTGERDGHTSLRFRVTPWIQACPVTSFYF